ncbi:hypothetical protein [Stenotrophomonas lactitubi]|uniref:hypothetical protein n=1 Tax=Stenotrophomonas lactitubi TaxID=2045214 RepID=UPI0033416FDE
MGCWALETDWAAWGSMIQAGAAVAMVGIAIWGLNSWKTELRGTKEQDLAEAVLAATYKYVAALSLVRTNSFASVSDMVAVERRPHETDDEWNARQPFGTVEPRLEQYLMDDYVQLRALIFKVQALFSDAEVDAIRRLLDFVPRLRRAALAASTAAVCRLHADQELTKLSNANGGFDPGLQQLSDDWRDVIEEMSAILWEKTRDDTISKEIAEATRRIEGLMKGRASFSKP